MNLAQEAYEAYANHTGWKSLATGSPLPQWHHLSKAIQEAWQVSAGWVIGRVRREFSETHEVLSVEWSDRETTLRVKGIIEPVAAGDSVCYVRPVVR